MSAPPETRRCSRSPSIERTRGTRSRHDAQLVRCASLTHSARKHSSRSSASSFPFAASSHTLFLNRAVQRTLFSKQRTVFSSLFVRGSSLPTSYLEQREGCVGRQAPRTRAIARSRQRPFATGAVQWLREAQLICA